MQLAGIGKDRLHLAWVSSAEAQRFVEIATGVTESIKAQGRFDPEAPKHLPKVAFLMLMRDERLATLSAEFDEETTTLTLRRDGKQVRAEGTPGQRPGSRR